MVDSLKEEWDGRDRDRRGRQCHFLGFRIKFGFATKLHIDPTLLSQHGIR